MTRETVEAVLTRTTQAAQALTGGNSSRTFARNNYTLTLALARLDLMAEGYEKWDADTLARAAWSRGAQNEAPLQPCLHTLRDAMLRARARLGCIAMPSEGGRPVATMASEQGFFVGYLFGTPGKKGWSFDYHTGPLSYADAIAYLESLT